ncbi:MAG: glycosyl hydrolase, partial [Planctomycetes bacterium]|nr:glycosyl hydrolase [Planctomycetota bacterium]
LSVYDGQPRYLDVFNRGEQPFAFTIEVRDPWLQVDVPRGTVDRERRIWVSARWNEVPVGADHGALTVTGPNGVKVEVVVPILNPTVPRPSDLDGFVEANGYVSIEAEHCTRAVAPAAREWKVIPNHGRTLSGVTPWPVTTAAVVDATHGMRLEYHMYLFSQGAVSVEVYLASTQKFQPGPGFRYAMSFDDETPQVVNVHADESLAAWERAVADGVKVLTSRHTIERPGYHVLKFWAIDPGLVLQKLVVNTGGVRPSYLGPPESARGRAAAR